MHPPDNSPAYACCASGARLRELQNHRRNTLFTIRQAILRSPHVLKTNAMRAAQLLFVTSVAIAREACPPPDSHNSLPQDIVLLTWGWDGIMDYIMQGFLMYRFYSLIIKGFYSLTSSLLATSKVWLWLGMMPNHCVHRQMN